jgi:hypothetical protein
MMRLQPIAFINDPRYRIDETGQVFAMRTREGRARGQYDAKWEPCEPLTLARARNLARSAADCPFELVTEASRVKILLHPDGSQSEFAEPFRATWCVRHEPKAAPGDVSWPGRLLDAAGDVERGWYRLTTAGGTVWIFHGESLIHEIRSQIH